MKITKNIPTENIRTTTESNRAYCIKILNNNYKGFRLQNIVLKQS